jgi:hypothetical protein
MAGFLAVSILLPRFLAIQEAPLTDPDAWKKNVADIVSQKNQAKDAAAKREQVRKDQVLAEHERAREVLRGQPEEGFQEFAAYLQSQGETVGVRHGLDDAKGPWIGIDVSDGSGLVMDVILQARIGAADASWVWVYEYRGNRRKSLEQQVQLGDAGPTTRYVIETLAEHYQKASTSR